MILANTAGRVVRAAGCPFRRQPRLRRSGVHAVVPPGVAIGFHTFTAPTRSKSTSMTAMVEGVRSHWLQRNRRGIPAAADQRRQVAGAVVALVAALAGGAHEHAVAGGPGQGVDRSGHENKI